MQLWFLACSSMGCWLQGVGNDPLVIHVGDVSGPVPLQVNSTRNRKDHRGIDFT